MILKIIKNDADYNEALEQLSSLLQKTPRTSDEENTIQILLLIIKDFEQKYEETFEVDPIETIKFRIEQMGLKQKDLVPFLGSLSKVSEVLSGKRSLSLAMIRKLHQGLEIPLKSLIGSKKLKSKTSKVIDYTLFPLKEMQQRGYFGNVKKRIADLKEYAEELITEFCGEYTDILEQNVALLRSPLHRRGKKQLNQHNLTIWQISVLKKAASHSDKKLPKFEHSSIERKWLRKLITLSQYSDGHIRAKEYLEKAGIALVIEPHFPKTFLDGAAIMYQGKPIIALTLRHNRIDNFWFVLAHELAHLIQHLGVEETSFFIDDLEESKQLDNFEIEADRIANEALIPLNVDKNHLLRLRSYKEIADFAKQIQVNPAIVAGRIRYIKNNFQLFPKFMHQPVIF
jgi:HTH-type transcriptional regulator / antitoxin HigA